MEIGKKRYTARAIPTNFRAERYNQYFNFLISILKNRKGTVTRQDVDACNAIMVLCNSAIVPLSEEISFLRFRVSESLSIALTAN